MINADKVKNKENNIQRIDMTIKNIVAYITKQYQNVAEIGIGHFPHIAQMLKQHGVHVFATDIYPFTHDGMHIYTDDVTDPSTFLYRDRELLYSFRPPIELVPYIVRLAKLVMSDVLIKPLSSEYPGGALMNYGNTRFFKWNIR